jgi:hypothetical protein
MVCFGVEKDMGGSARDLRRKRGYKHIKSAFWKASNDQGALARTSADMQQPRKAS